MAISRSQLVKELEPGLNALFGLEYQKYENEHAEIFNQESSDRAFEEEVMLTGFGNAPVKQEGAAVTFDSANEAYTARYSHETVALAFSILKKLWKIIFMTDYQLVTQKHWQDQWHTQSRSKQQTY